MSFTYIQDGGVRTSTLASAISFLHNQGAELAAAHLEPEVRALHEAVDGPDRLADGHPPLLHKGRVLVPEGHPTETAVVSQLEVHHTPARAVLAGERPHRGHSNHARAQVRLGALLQVLDGLEGRDAAAEPFHDD